MHSHNTAAVGSVEAVQSGSEIQLNSVTIEHCHVVVVVVEVRFYVAASPLQFFSFSSPFFEVACCLFTICQYRT